MLESQSLTPASLRKLKDRYIPQVPERILDAPDFVNDYCKLFFAVFCLCSSTRISSESLGSSVYSMFSSTHKNLCPCFLLEETWLPLLKMVNVCIAMKRALASVQERVQHATRTRFVAHVNLSLSLLASDRINRLQLIINGLTIKIILFHFIINSLYRV